MQKSGFRRNKYKTISDEVINQTNTAAENTLRQNVKPDFSNDETLPSTIKRKFNSTLEKITYDEDSFFFLIHFKQLKLMVEKYSCCQSCGSN